jgi:hypothetical protein
MLEHFQQILAVPGDQPRLPLVDVHLVPAGNQGKQNGKQPQESVGRGIFARGLNWARCPIRNQFRLHARFSRTESIHAFFQAQGYTSFILLLG